MAAPLTSGASWASPLGIRVFMIGFGRLRFTFSEQPSLMLPSTKKPVFMRCTSLLLMRLVTASNNTGYIFLGLRLMQRFSTSHRVTSWMGSSSESYLCGGSEQVSKAVSTTSLSICSFVFSCFFLVSAIVKRKSMAQILSFSGSRRLPMICLHTQLTNSGFSLARLSAIAVKISITR